MRIKRTATPLAAATFMKIGSRGKYATRCSANQCQRYRSGLMTRLMKTSRFARRSINSGQWLASGNQCGDERRNAEGARNKRTPVLGRPKLQTVVGGTAVKAPMSTGVARHRVKQIVGLSRIGRFVGQLAGVTLLGKISVEQSREKFVRHDRLHAGAPDPDLAAPRMGGIDDRVGCNLGLENRRDRLWPVAHLVARPVELRGIERRHLDHDQVYVDPVMQQFRPQAVGEPADREFGAAISRLQRYSPVAEG